MAIYSLLIATLLIALASIYLLVAALRYPLRYGWYRVLMAVVLGVFIYLYGAWVLLSVYTRYVFAVGFLITLLVSAARQKEKQLQKPRVAAILTNVWFTVLFLLLEVLYFTGITGTPETIDLTFPLHHGNYFVLQGGKGLPTNVFHYGYRGTIYAMDLAKLNSMGNRASRIFSTKLSDYEIFGDTVYSPCNGIVQSARGNRPDNIPPARVRGHGSLNSVLIAAPTCYIFMGHFKQNSLMVHEGDTVTAGQPIALAGNSGFSLEPHLHIQAHKRTNTDIPWYREAPLFITFGGKSYLLFQQIKSG